MESIVTKYDNSPREVQEVIKHLTAYAIPIGRNELDGLINKIKKNSKSGQLIISLIQPFLVQRNNVFGNPVYCPHPEIYIHVFVELFDSKQSDDYQQKAQKLFYRPWGINVEFIPILQKNLLAFLQGKKASLSLDIERVDGHTMSVINVALLHERFNGFEKQLKDALVMRMIDVNYQQIFFYLNPSPRPAQTIEKIAASVLPSSPIYSILEAWHNISSFIRGDFKQIHPSKEMTIGDMFLSGALLLKEGETEKAFSVIYEANEKYKKVLKCAIPDQTIIKLFVVLTFAVAHKKKINTSLIPKLLKKKEVKTDLLAYIYFSLVSGVEQAEIKNHIGEFSVLNTPAIELLFIELITQKYNLTLINRSFFDYKKFIQLIADSDFHWYQLELFPLLEESETSLEELKGKLNILPVTSAFDGYKAWEHVLDTLLNIEEKGNENQRQSRIAYLWQERRDNTDTNRIESIHVVPIFQQMNLNGNWGKGRSIAAQKFLEMEVEGMTQQDRAIASVSSAGGWHHHRSSPIDPTQVLSKMVGHPYILLEENRDVHVELQSVNPEITIKKHKKGIEITANVGVSDDLLILIRETNARYKLVQLNVQQRKIINQLLTIKIFPHEAEPKIKEMLGKLSSLITIFSDIDEARNIKMIEGDTRIVVQLLPVGQSLKAELFVKPITGHPPYLKPSVGTMQTYALHEGEKVNIKRNLPEEKENLQQVTEALNSIPANSEQEDIYFFEEPQECLELFDALRSLEQRIIIEWPEGVKFRLIGRAGFDNLNMRVTQKMNWFEMEGEITIDEHTVISLLDLIKAVRKSPNRFIELKEGEFIALSNKLRKQLLDIESVAQTNKKSVSMPIYASSLIDSMEQNAIHLKTDKKVERLREKIKSAQTLHFDVPRNLQADLRNYQTEGYEWMCRLSEWGAGACLADDMGLGKTVQTIAVLLKKASEGASLVVVPASVQPNWERELSKFAPTLRVINVNTQTDRSKAIKEAESYDICLVTYGVLQTESETITSKQFAVAVLDEAHIIKNSETKVSKAAMKINADFRIALTGTPIQNHLGEIWNLFQFTNPSLLGSREMFNERFVRPIVEYKDKEQQNRLRKLIAPFLLRRTKSTVLEELPPKTEIQHDIQLTDAEIALYEGLRRDAEKVLSEQPEMNKIEALSLITKLRMAACHIGLTNPEMGYNSSKTQALIELVEELVENNHRALVFSQFTSHLALIKKALDDRNIKYLYLDGATPIKERDKLVKTFQGGEMPLFLISLKAGGLGLNLTAADYVFHVDPWWNPAIEDQASDRSHRIGQTRPVTIYRLVAKNTIEEKILRLHASKKELADSLLEGTEMAHKITTAEILDLLK